MSHKENLKRLRTLEKQYSRLKSRQNAIDAEILKMKEKKKKLNPAKLDLSKMMAFNLTFQKQMKERTAAS